MIEHMKDSIPVPEKECEVGCEKEPVLYGMHADIRFNRCINRETDYISPGGFEFKMNDTSFQFDFCKYWGEIDAEDAAVLHVTLKQPDTDSFPSILKMIVDDILHVNAIPEFLYLPGNLMSQIWFQYNC